MNDYSIFNPKVSAPLHILGRKEALEHYELFVSQIDKRIKEIRKLLKDSNIELDFSIESVKQLDEWFVINMRANSSDQLSAKSFSICNDLSMYFGEIVKRNCSSVDWKLNTVRSSDISYHRPVLIGFDVKNKNYNIDFDLILCQYAQRIIKNNADDKGLLFRMVFSALEKCKKLM
jgi:hypothetical protein